jgi:hypothetical protein
MSDSSATLSDSFLGESIEDYRALSRAAVGGFVLGLIGLLGFSWYPILVFPVVGGFLAFIGLSNIRKYPDELTGKPFALAGGLLSLVTLAFAPALHVYTYLTEVPEGYERISFSQLKGQFIDVDVPPESAVALDGKPIFLKGYILPTSVASSSASRFILVPDLATCCFGGEPKKTHMVEVVLSQEATAKFRLRQVKLAGTLHVNPVPNSVEALQSGFYQLKADIYRP